ncbi:MAG: zinc ribbon domain-containing protein [Terriglobia bacterium]
MYCPKCGDPNDDNNYRCPRCGTHLHAAPDAPAPITVADDAATLGGLIPYKNPSALIAYYLGVFSLIPFLGIPLGIAALIYGLKGLKYAREHPESKGKIHAWIGVGVGGFFGFAYLIVALLVVFNLAVKR